MTAPASAAERVAQEDLVLFINACFACSGQSEFYGTSESQSVSIRFLHEYILGNYRRLYARTLAAGVNHFNQALIIKNLLLAGAPKDLVQRREEGQLILAALLGLPPQRAYHLFRELRQQRVNNRRTRAVLREFCLRRPDLAFDAVKYRPHLRAAMAHAHLRLPGEVGTFLFAFRQQRAGFVTPLFERFRQAHYAEDALYDLPYTIAAGLARRHRIPDDVFLSRIQARMTAAEKLRLLKTSQRVGAEPIEIDLARAPLTKLCLYLLSYSPLQRRAQRAELVSALRGAAERALRLGGRGRRLGRVAAILDCSFSSSGSQEKRRRPLAVALAASQLLRAASREYRAIWTPMLQTAGSLPACTSTERSSDVPVEVELEVQAHGQTALGEPLLAALAFQPDLMVIVSDGFENDPPGVCNHIVRWFRQHIDRQRRIAIVHANPVFDSDRFMPRSLGAAIPTMGLRDAEDLLTMLGFARFADGSAPLSELEQYLSERLPLLLSRLDAAAGRGPGEPASSLAGAASAPQIAEEPS